MLAFALLGCGTKMPRSALSLPAPETGVCSTLPASLTLGRSTFSRTRPGASLVASSCAPRAAPECSYTFDVLRRSDLRATLFSQNFDGALSLTMPGEHRELACADDSPLGDTHRARLDLPLEPGRYALHVEAASEQLGDFELFAELEPLAQRDQVCAAAERLIEGSFVRGSTRGEASAFDDSCEGRGKGSDHGYVFSLERAQRVRLRAQSEFEALLSLRASCTGSELACSSDGQPGRAYLATELAAGDYYLLVDGYVRGEGGDFVLALERTDIPASHDHARRCAVLPTLREDELTEIDTLREPATSQASCGGESAPEALYMFELREPRQVSVFASEFEFKPVFSLRRACEYGESEVICAALPRRSEVALESSEQLVFELELPAGDYMLGIDGQATDQMGAGSVRLHSEPAHR